MWARRHSSNDTGRESSRRNTSVSQPHSIIDTPDSPPANHPTADFTIQPPPTQLTYLPLVLLCFSYYGCRSEPSALLHQPRSRRIQLLGHGRAGEVWSVRRTHTAQCSDNRAAIVCEPTMYSQSKRRAVNETTSRACDRRLQIVYFASLCLHLSSPQSARHTSAIALSQQSSPNAHLLPVSMLLCCHLCSALSRWSA